MPTRPPTHRPAHGTGAETRAKHDLWRGTSASRGYDNDWRKVRLAHLKSEPLCRFCQQTNIITIATMVDHIKPIVTHPELRLDDTNLRSLCESHHNALTATQVAGGHVGMVGRAKR